MIRLQLRTGFTQRRSLILGAAAACIEPWGLAEAHAAAGPVAPPQAIPVIAVTSTGGQSIELSRLLTGGITAVQTMFTGCTATCPIQGAIFADVQRHLGPADTNLRLLSVSIDPLGDDARALRTWLGRFDAQPQRWRAAVVRMSDVDRLLDFLRSRADGPDRHTAQAFLFNSKAQLAFRTTDLPTGNDVANLMREMASMR
ncbi:SCO family protein [Methylibium sp.]|uniref:SCO family protein n=1 Tax=Methylibium sp. TaxID=2067992 RepID=UPI0017B5F40F|nr:SCO family protein [Methylibium sp.]MBA3590642.1 SCO family protein [Methylibium sp.]